MTLPEEMFLAFWDKVFLGAIVGFAIFAWTRIEKERDRLHERLATIEIENKKLKHDSELRKVDVEINLLEKQLEIFYWPLWLCLSIDDALWTSIPDLADDDTQLPEAAGKTLETEILIPNHERATDIIRNGFHLVAEKENLLELLVAYIEHVAVLTALRMSNTDQNPIDVEKEFPHTLPERIKTEIENTRTQLQILKKKRTRLVGSMT